MYRRFVGAFDHAAAFASCALVVALLVDVSLGAITRTMGDPLIWTDELARFLMVWLAVLGWIVASRKQLHVRIRFFQDLLPAPIDPSPAPTPSAIALPAPLTPSSVTAAIGMAVRSIRV